MTIIDVAASAALVAVTDGGRVRLERGDRSTVLHPIWLRNRSEEPGQIEPVSRQRLFTPRDVALDLVVTACRVDGGSLLTSFSDGHEARLDLAGIERELGWIDDEEEPPAPEPWTSPLDPFPYVDWSGIGWSDADADPDAVLAYLDAFHRYGYVVFRNTPAEEGAVRRVCDRLGYMSGNNFGWVFDVRTDPKPTDLAYTSIELLAHTDQPYRQPTPGIQLLHCLRNEAPGGDSTLADGLAAAQALQAADAEAWRACVETEVVFRYDMISDTVVSRGHILEYDRHGRFRQIRLNTKLDTPVPQADGDLDAFYRGRRWLTGWLNDAAHQVTFRLEPGDVMFMDNIRVLHGRTAFDASKGVRHLQGAYIDHDGPDTMYRLAIRRNRTNRTGGAS
jgi:gamma-butyrobetaine dioxygenase